MAHQEITGRTEDGIEERRKAFNERNPDRDFEKVFCLAKIPNQPEEYDGPPRYCLSTQIPDDGPGHVCKFHGGAGSLNTQNLEKLAPMKHGMKATREHLVEDFDEKDRALYDWVAKTYPEAYGIDVEESPADAYDMHRLAAEIVRAERGRGFILNEGEVNEEPVRNEEGRVVVNDEGEVVTEKSEHYLNKMLDRQDKKITQLEKELGITRKERRRAESEDSAVEALQSFSELGKAFVNRDEKDYSADDTPWEDDESG